MAGDDHHNRGARGVAGGEAHAGARLRSYARELARFARANTSSVLATGCDWFVVALLAKLGVFYLIARPFGAFSGAVVDFTLKRHWVFRRTRKAAMTIESVRYVLVSATSLVWTTASCFLFVEVAHTALGTAVIASSIAVGLAWNYPLHRLFVFVEPPPA